LRGQKLKVRKGGRALKPEIRERGRALGEHTLVPEIKKRPLTQESPPRQIGKRGVHKTSQRTEKTIPRRFTRV